MNWERNFPRPSVGVIYADCGLSARTEIVTELCEHTNEVSEFVLGIDAPKVEVPGQGNVDERMPLRFLRPCVDVINSMIEANDFDVPLVPMPGNNMDYHGFVPLARSIAQALNGIIEAT